MRDTVMARGTRLAGPSGQFQDSCRINALRMPAASLHLLGAARSSLYQRTKRATHTRASSSVAKGVYGRRVW